MPTQTKVTPKRWQVCHWLEQFLNYANLKGMRSADTFCPNKSNVVNGRANMFPSVSLSLAHQNLPLLIILSFIICIGNSDYEFLSVGLIRWKKFWILQFSLGTNHDEKKSFTFITLFIIYLLDLNVLYSDWTRLTHNVCKAIRVEPFLFGVHSNAFNVINILIVEYSVCRIIPLEFDVRIKQTKWNENKKGKLAVFYGPL